MKKALLIGIFALFALVTLPQGARAITGSDTGTSTRPSYPVKVKDVVKDRNQQIKNETEKYKQTTQDLRKDVKDYRATTTEKTKEVRQDIKEYRASTTQKIKEVRSELRENVKEIREEFRTKLGEMKKMRMEAHFERVLRRLEAAFDRLTTLSDRIASRITTLDAQNPNFDSTQPNTYLGVARTKISEGEALFSQLPTQFKAIFENTNSTPQTQFEEVHKLTGAVKTKAKEAHQALVNAIRSIKAQTNTSTSPTATTTATSTSN